MNPSRKNVQKKQVSIKQSKKPMNKNNNKQMIVRKPRESQITPLTRYAAALCSPFADAAVGAQVPDMYAFPTATYHAEGTIIVQTNASGVASLMLVPHPTFSALDMTTASVSSSGMTQYTATPTAYAAITSNNLNAQLANFRTVGCGYEIRNLLPPTTATGRCIVTPVPVSGQLPGPNALSLSPLTNSYISTEVIGFGTPAAATTVGFASDLLALPLSQEVTMQDLISQELGFSARPIGPSAFDFRSTNAIQFSTTIGVVGGNNETIAISALDPNNSRDNINHETALGWNAFALRFEGCPANTIIAEIKYVLHIEGTPNLQFGSGIMAPGIGAVSHVNPKGHIDVLTKVLDTPFFQLATKAVGALGDKFLMPGYSSLQNSILAKLGFSV